LLFILSLHAPVDKGLVDLENFVRGWNENEPNKGKVLYSANVTEHPHFDQFQRPAFNPIRDRFMGFFGMGSNNQQHQQHNNNNNNSGYDSDDDGYYIRHPKHVSKFTQGRRHQVPARLLFPARCE
jgi:hypothetical protein